MKKKIFKRSLALGALMAFVMTGNVMARSIENEDANITDKNIMLGRIFVSNSANYSNHNIVVGNDTTKSVSIGSFMNTYGVMVWGFYNYNTACDIKIEGKIIDIMNNSFERGAIEADYGAGTINIIGDTVNIENFAEGGNGVLVANGTTYNANGITPNGTISTVNIKGDKINIETDFGNAIKAISEGVINIEGKDVTLIGDNAIKARGDAKVSINENIKGTVKLDGNISFHYDGPSSGTGVDAYVTVNLTGADSYWNGNTVVTWNRGANEVLSMDDKLKVNNLKITLSDGAQWNPELVKEEGELGGANGTKGSRYIALNNLNLNNGIVNIDVAKTQEQAIQVENLGGTGGTVNFTVDKTGGALKTGTFQVFAGAEATQVSTNYTGINADDIGTKEKFKGLVQESLKIGENSKATFTAHIEEGLLTPAMTGVTTNNINGNTIELQDIQQGKSTTTMDAMRDIASTAIIAWRQEDSTLSQRLGELRNSEGDQGVWVRMSRGEFEYSGAYKNQYNYFQMGYDKAYGDWHYGAAISHNDGQTAYANGKGDNRSTSLSLYGTWLGASGQYADIVLKQGRLSNEFEIHTAAGDTRGDYDAWGTSLSGEYGVKMDMSDGWYVTPQAQLTFMRIGGEDYTTSNNIRVSQDTLYSTVGRVGFELGKNITDKGSVYAKASLLHEFAGDADTYLRLGDLHNSYSQDIGNTWYEAGLGFNYKTGADSYVYADVVKTFGDDIKTPWQWNVGMRWSF